MNNKNFKSIEWDEKVFLSSRDEWQKLLKSSNADNLFMSWQWMSQWWINLGGRSSDKLYIIAIYLKDELVGIAPLYINESNYLNGLVPIKRLQFIGTRYRGSSGPRTEYLGTIVKSGLEFEVNTLISRVILKSRNWDEIILSDLVRDGSFYRQIINDADKTKLRTRILASDECYSVNTEGSFSEYLGSLGKNTRLKLFNRRKALAECGDISLEYVDLRKSEDIFRYINDFHIDRYGNPPFGEQSVALLRNVINSLPESAEFRCSSLLKVDKRFVSAIVNIHLNGKIYNFQLGFLEDFDKRISLGTLHLGYAIEMAFKSEEVKSFDLLAGEGKKSNYKSRLAQHHSTLQSIQIIRNSFVRLMYFVNDKFKGTYTKTING